MLFAKPVITREVQLNNYEREPMDGDKLPTYFYIYWKLKASELLEEVEPLMLAIANQLATEAALLDRLDSGSI
jgi:hypothetical protein